MNSSHRVNDYLIARIDLLDSAHTFQVAKRVFADPASS